MVVDINLMSRLLRGFTVEYESCDSALWPVSIRADFGLVLTHMDLIGSVDMNKDTCVIDKQDALFNLNLFR